jgi:hypothetical protein
MRRFLIALVFAAIAVSSAVSRESSSVTSGRTIARSESRSHRGEVRSESRNSSTGHTNRTRTAVGHVRSTPARCATCERDANGRIKRNPAARRSFQMSNPCPATGRTSGACPGYVVDHIVPLKRGGVDEPANMQWQTVTDAKAKDRIE